MGDSASLFVPREVTLFDLASCFGQVFPKGGKLVVSADSIQLIPEDGMQGYAEVMDASLAGFESGDLDVLWEQSGEPPPEAVYCAPAGFRSALGEFPKQMAITGSPRELLRAVLLAFADDARIWVMMYNGKYAHGDELRAFLTSGAFFDRRQPW